MADSPAPPTYQWLLRWWPAIAVGAMLVLGIVVRPGSTALDDWFLHSGNRIGAVPDVLLVISDPGVMITLAAAAVLGALWRQRWWLAAIAATFPPAAVLLARVLKRLFGRQKGGELAYPSGHTALMVVTLGMVLAVMGWRLWAVAVAAVLVVLGMLGLAMTYHYFTDTLGSLLLGTAVVCLAVRLAHRLPPGGRYRGGDRHRIGAPSNGRGRSECGLR